VAFEHPTSAGVVRLTKAGRHWVVRFVGKARGRWRSPDAAAHAVASHQTGIPEWDRFVARILYRRPRTSWWSHQPIRMVAGIPKLVIRFSALHPIFASTR
jgi:hypothetical protein